MQVITNATVKVVGHSVFQDHPQHEIPPDGTDAERIGAFAAKGCYDSHGKDGRPCVENQKTIIQHAHGSVLEHSYASLFIEGVTRALTLELNRHRPFNISQRSTRYTREEDSAIVLEPFYASIWNRYHLTWDEDTNTLVIPEEYDNPDPMYIADENVWPHDLHLVYRFVYSCYDSLTEYGQQVDALVKLNPNNLGGFDLRKWARGKARNVLPHALETRGTWTANYRAWRWFIEARSNRHAEPEIRMLAEKVLHELRPLAPTYFDDFRLSAIVDGIPEWVPTYRKI
jgi:thymidylate synthase (FAD)